MAVAEAPVEASTHPQTGCIYINGNSEFTTDHGVTGGSGTGPDPYIIEGWEIKGCFDGIHIQNTDAQLIIRNVYVHSVDQFGSAILLFNVANAVIDNVTLKGSDGGAILAYGPLPRPTSSFPTAISPTSRTES